MRKDYFIAARRPKKKMKISLFMFAPSEIGRLLLQIRGGRVGCLLWARSVFNSFIMDALIASELK